MNEIKNTVRVLSFLSDVGFIGMEESAREILRDMMKITKTPVLTLDEVQTAYEQLLKVPKTKYKAPRKKVGCGKKAKLKAKNRLARKIARKSKVKNRA